MAEAIPQQQVSHDPICPHCNQPVTELHWRRLKAMGQEYLYMCPHCRKVLGISRSQ